MKPKHDLNQPKTCPFHELREELPKDIPPNIAALPRDDRGYPVPYFVQWVDGKPHFPIMDTRRYKRCAELGLCWVCGKPMEGDLKAFTIGPMCIVNRTTAEPPGHIDCADWSARACPFLTKPQMRRNDSDWAAGAFTNAPGLALERNPGVACVWITRHWDTFPDGKGSRLIRIGPPEEVRFYARGRKATREEILYSIETGIPLLLETVEHEPPAEQEAARAELQQWVERARRLVPAA